jgi:type III polyketide synthase
MTTRIKRVLQLSRASGIETRPSIRPLDDPIYNRSTAPSLTEIDRLFRKSGVDLTVQACKRALREWGGDISNITHSVAVTCTNGGHPGFDLLVIQKLGMPVDTDRLLINGTGCAGGLSALRAAANIASGSSLRGKAARVLVFSCELGSTYSRSALDQAAENPENFVIAPAIFSDGAAALVLCNEFAPEAKDRGIYSIMDWKTTVLPDTYHYSHYLPEEKGM